MFEIEDAGVVGEEGRRKRKLVDGNKKPVATGSRYIGPLFNVPPLSSSLFSTTLH